MGKTVRVLFGALAGLCLLAPARGWAQRVPIGNLRTLKGTALDPHTRTLYALWPDSIRLYLAPDYRKSRLVKVPRLNPDFPLSYDLATADSTLYLVEHMGGKVYRLEGDSLRRIDRSFTHKMQINSTVFVENDTIFRYGGYGFWSHRNFFTYFSKASQEWEVVAPTGSEEVPPGSDNSFVTRSGPYWYVFGGRVLDPVDPLTFRENRDLWRYHTGEKRWEFLGTLNRDFEKTLMVVHLGDKIVVGNANKYEFLLVDPGNNRVTTHEIGPKNYGVLPMDINRRQGGSFYHDGQLYVLKNLNLPRAGDPDGKVGFEIRPLEDFLGPAVREEALYGRAGFPWGPAGGALGAALVVALLVLGRRKYRERDKILVGDWGMRYKGRRLDTDPRSLAVLLLLLRADHDVPAQAVLDLVEKPHLNPAHNIKVRNQVVDNLNFRFKTLLDTEEDLIQAYRSEQDKRIKVYRIDKAPFRLRQAGF